MNTLNDCSILTFTKFFAKCIPWLNIFHKLKSFKIINMQSILFSKNLSLWRNWMRFLLNLWTNWWNMQYFHFNLSFLRLLSNLSFKRWSRVLIRFNFLYLFWEVFILSRWTLFCNFLFHAVFIFYQNMLLRLGIFIICLHFNVWWIL